MTDTVRGCERRLVGGVRLFPAVVVLIIGMLMVMLAPFEAAVLRK